MHDSERTETLARAVNRNTYKVSHDSNGSDETANHCTMFIIGTAAFVVGFWAVVCLVSVVLHKGPLVMLKSLATAVSGF